MTQVKRIKTKTEILECIKRIREGRDSYSFMKLKAFRDICNGQIRMLQWVLGYDIGKWFWCVRCQKQHKGLDCPSCGNGTKVMPLARGECDG